jgi:hypothetical protein
MSSRRLPAVAFALLSLATLGAFFLVQAIKTADPLIWPTDSVIPAAFNPVHGRVCRNSKGPLDYRHTQLQIAVPRADTVGVYIVSAGNQSQTLATVSNGTPMRRSVLAKNSNAWYPATFTWNGLLASGNPAPPGIYYFRVVLEHQGRSLDISDHPIRVLTQPPHPRILSVRLVGESGGASTTTTTSTHTGTGGGTSTAGATTAVTVTTGTTRTGTRTGSTDTGTRAGSTGTASAAATGPPVLSPPDGKVRITFKRGAYRRARIDIYRTDVAGRPVLVTTVKVRTPSRNWVTWDGEIHGAPAPAGTYLVGITAQDQACNQGSWPAMPPAANSTPGAGVTIRYLTVSPPLTPTVSGSRATVAVDSPGSRFIWKLRRSGTTKVLAHGRGRAGSSEIRVRMPRRQAGLYTLVVRSATQSAAVPLVASRAGAAAAHAPVLVVLPMLSWIGNSPVDDSGNGLPDTLRHGDAVLLNRPLVDGPPGSLGADGALLAYLDSQHLSYQLTTDVALAEGKGPSLIGRSGLLFPDGSNFLPGPLAGGVGGLPGFVRAGGRVLTLGTGTFEAISRLRVSPAAASASAATIRAAAPIFSSADPFGAQRGPITPTGGQLITDLTDRLGLFGPGLTFSGFSQYQPITPPGSTTAVSEAGISDQSAAIVGFSYGSGMVIEVGLPNFGLSLAHDLDSQELLYNAWHLLSTAP